MLENIKSYFTTKYFASGFDVFLLGMSMSVCGTCFVWRYAMQTHFYEYLTGMIIVTVMYVCLVLCVAEMMSALPFSGGIYGLARVALSPYIGFLVGILEVFKNIFHISCCVQPLAMYVGNVLKDDLSNQPLYWLVILGSVTVISIIGGKVFLNFNRILGLACLAFTIMYLCTPMMNRADFKLYANTNYFFQPVHNFEFHRFLEFAGLAVWFYIGIELIPFTCAYVKNPTRVVPYSMIAILAVLIIFAFGVYFTACSQFPGALRLYYYDLPLMFGYADMLGITYENACWFSITCIYASVFAFMFGCGRQIASLSESGLLPSFLKWKTMYSETPYMSIITTAVLCYLTMISVRFSMRNTVNIIYYICLTGALVSYVSVFVTYIQFKRKYVTLKRDFTNPLGIYAAVLGIFISLFVVIGLLAFTTGEDAIPAPITLAIVWVVASIYYFTFASKKQYYSEEEQKAFLLTYVINSNGRGRKKYKKKPNNKDQSFYSTLLSLAYSQRTESSLSTSARKFFTLISKNLSNSKYSLQSHINNKVKPAEELSMGTKDLESNIGISLTVEQATKETEEKKENHHKVYKNSIDFSHLPSLEALKHIRDEIELKQDLEVAADTSAVHNVVPDTYELIDTSHPHKDTIEV